MAELATIARPYAEALFKATQSDMAGTAQWLTELAQVASHQQLLQFAADPKVTPEKVYDMVVGLLKSKASQVAQNFLRTVIENGRLAALPEVAAQYRAHLNALGGSSDALVYSAFEIDAATLASMGDALQKRFGRKLNLTVKLDSELIGGIRVVVGDEVLDTSVKARLEQMKVSLTA
jgi:F-type H+-transporting ATPase subunit delta